MLSSPSGILYLFLIVPITLAFFDDDFFDFDSDEVYFPNYDYFYPQHKQSNGVCNFYLDKPYNFGDFRVKIYFDSPTTGLTVSTEGFLTYNQKNYGMDYSLINFRIINHRYLCIRFSYSYYSANIHYHPGYRCEQMHHTNPLPTITTAPTRPPTTTPAPTQPSTTTPVPTRPSTTMASTQPLPTTTVSTQPSPTTPAPTQPSTTTTASTQPPTTTTASTPPTTTTASTPPTTTTAATQQSTTTPAPTQPPTTTAPTQPPTTTSASTQPPSTTRASTESVTQETTTSNYVPSLPTTENPTTKPQTSTPTTTKTTLPTRPPIPDPAK